LRFGLDAYAVRPPPHLDAAIGSEQVRLELAQRFVGLVLSHSKALGQRGQRGQRDRTVGGDQQGFDLGLQLPAFFHARHLFLICGGLQT
jgi:hypothetical protein